MRSLQYSVRYIFPLLLMALLAACSVNVHKDKSGEDKKVDIDTPLGGIHVSNDADARDVGIAVYPGATPVQKNDGDDNKSANVNISSGYFRLKVVALEYHSEDAPEKVLAFYKKELKRYGDVLECHTSKHGNASVELSKDDSQDNSKELKCEGDGGKNIELKVGTRDKQHVVSIEPDGKGSKFALVFVQTRGQETI
ncbi:MAG: hypothetical protein JST79_15335 [Acidobacteria bacterium]|nr:hypothetical protein [Acidobacteriota bacterium]